MIAKQSKIYHYITTAWLTVCGIVMVFFSVCSDRIPSLFRGKLFGIFGCFAVVILSGIGYAAGELSWLDVPAGRKDRPYAGRLFLVFLVGTGLQILYAVYAAERGRVSLLQDSMVTSGIFCATAMAARWAAELNVK